MRSLSGSYRLVSGQLQGTHPDGGNQTRLQNTGESDDHGYQACEEPLRNQIAVADGKRGDEREIERIAERPSLKKADKRPQHELKDHEPRHNWPNDTQLLP